MLGIRKSQKVEIPLRQSVRLGTFYLRAERPFAALWELHEARSLDPNDYSTRLSEADALQAARFPDLALTELHALLPRHPGRVEICSRMAEIYLATGRTGS